MANLQRKRVFEESRNRETFGRSSNGKLITCLVKILLLNTNFFKKGNEHFKTVFVAFFQGEQLKTRIKKVCAGFHASLYPCPNTYKERMEMLQGVKTRLEDLQMVLNQTEDHRQRVLVSSGFSSLYFVLYIYITYSG